MEKKRLMSKIRSKNYRDKKNRREKQATTHDESDESETEIIFNVICYLIFLYQI